MELWLDAASSPSLTEEPHPADRVLLAEGQIPPGWCVDSLIACDDGRILDDSGQLVGSHVRIDDAEGQDSARSLIGLSRWLVLTCGDWQMIPLENMVAEASGSGTMLVARIDNALALRGAAFALQTGVDALLLPPAQDSDGEDLWMQAQEVAAERLAERSGGIEEQEEYVDDGGDVQLIPFTVTEILSGGFGDRVCIDLTSMLEVGEGMLIGSSAASLTLVHGETLASDFVPARPFRVNAGPVHAYVRMADGSTRYLCELASGDEVSICSPEGKCRAGVVGRLKIESRPFLLIHLCDEDSGREGQIFLQQAETVRIVTENGEAVSVTTLKPGKKVLGRLSRGAMHIGENVMIEVEER